MPHLETIKVNRDLPLAEIDGFIIKCNSGTAYALTAMYAQGELLVMDEQAVSLLAEVRDLLQAMNERETKWIEEIRRREKVLDKHTKQADAKYDGWRKEDVARLQRNEEIAQRNYDMASKLYAQQLEKAYWIGLNAERPEEEMPAEAIKESVQPTSRKEMLDLLKNEIDKAG